jgi:manganese/iron transport system substrate-binding protein
MLLNFALKRTAAIVAFTGLAGMLGCASTPQPTASTPPTASPEVTETPLVIATHTVLCDLTEQIAGDTIRLQCLIPPGTDVHVYQPTPEANRAIESADLILYGGYGFESGLIQIIEAISNTAPKVAVNEVAVPNPLLGGHAHESEHEGEEHAGDHEGEAHAEAASEADAAPDPHVWQNARNGIEIAEVIRDNLTELQPDRADFYSENTGKLTAELEQLDRWIQSQIATIPASARKLVTTHDALGYYADAYGMKVEGALLGISTEEAPTATRVRDLVEDIEATQVPTIFAETNINPELIETVAREANVKLADRQLYADSLGESGSADSYQKMLIANTQAIVEGLGGEFTAFEDSD